MSKLQVIVFLVLVVGYVYATDTHSLDILKKIWKYKQAIRTCDSKLNYGCRCTALSAQDLTCEFKCISLDRRCDGKVDCPLGDDETDCPAGTCQKGDICCTNGTCATLCNGVSECPENADEARCETATGTQCKGRMQCPNGNCATVCDGHLECDDDAGCDLDENKCKFICPPGRLICEAANGACAVHCDGTRQCTNGKDESTCYYECAADEISCELESSSLRGCVELCETTTGDCESEWDNDDVYCGTCMDCGVDDGCLKIQNSCP